MTVTNKTKTSITPKQKAKGIGASWGDTIASWGDTFFGWGEVEVITNKSKSTITPTNKPKTAA